jgi:hypothetical protein
LKFPAQSAVWILLVAGVLGGGVGLELISLGPFFNSIHSTAGAMGMCFLFWFHWQSVSINPLPLSFFKTPIVQSSKF